MNTRSQKEQGVNWLKRAFYIALERFQSGLKNAESVIQIGEDFDRNLNAHQRQEKINDCLQKTIEKDIFRPIRTDFIFTKMSDNITTVFMNRHPLVHAFQEPTIASLFDFRIKDRLSPNAFSIDEFKGNEMKNNTPFDFIFKENHFHKEELERERVE